MSGISEPWIQAGCLKSNFSHRQNPDVASVRRGTIPQPRKSQVVPSATASEAVSESPELVSWNVRRPSTELLVKSSREKISDCCALFVRDFTRCCDKIQDLSTSTQSKKTSRKNVTFSSALYCVRCLSVYFDPGPSRAAEFRSGMSGMSWDCWASRSPSIRDASDFFKKIMNKNRKSENHDVSLLDLCSDASETVKRS